MSRLKDTIIENNLKVGNIITDTITSSTINIDDGGGSGNSFQLYY